MNGRSENVNPQVADLPHGVTDDKTQEIAADLAYKRLAIANVVLVGSPGAADRQWVLVDTGVPGLTSFIEKAAKQRFGRSRPAAIILTHGHFDHVGGLKHLAKLWNVSIYAHSLEIPYLDGQMEYPPPDTEAGGGLMPSLAPFFPRGPIDVSLWLQQLPNDGTVPGMPGWRWLFTPGHSPGHVSLWKPSEQTLIAGDAFVTTNQDSVYSVIAQKPEIHGPPRYFTTDWTAAAKSVAALAALRPNLVVTGHGKAMKGPEMLERLSILARDFETLAVPEDKRSTLHDAKDPTLPGETQEPVEAIVRRGRQMGF